MKRTCKHLLCLLLTLAMVFSLAAPAFAEETDTETVDYLRYDAEAGEFVADQAACAVIDGSSTALSTGWYVVQGEVTTANYIQIKGTVNLILVDGAKLTAGKGIYVPEENTLNIFGQSGGTGELIATAVEEGYAGIGGAKNKACGSITIHGGTVTANGGKDGTGIGSGENGYGYSASITIYGGTVTANAGDHCAGIGGSRYGNSGTITIQDGTVTATGGADGGAGIGCGQDGDGGSITINGGDITANGGLYAAGIGGGEFNGGCSITINGGDVTATGGADGGAGIGGGLYGDGGSIKICGGTVTAIGGDFGAGIGGGWNGVCGSVEINGGSVIAIAGHNAVGIGGGYESSGNGTLVVGENVIVKGGADKDSLEVLEAPFETRPAYMTVTAYEAPVPVEADYLEYNLSTKEFDEKTAECFVIDENTTALSSGWYVVQDEVTIPGRIEIDGEVNLILADGAKLTAAKGIQAAEGNTLNIFGQTEGTGELIATAEGQYNAGIGSNGSQIDFNYDYEDSGSITIHGGIITATGAAGNNGMGDGGAGIGGGCGGDGGSITIHGGTVTATGGDSSAAIGGGVIGDGGIITINGGTVKATGQETGIGGGAEGSGGNITINGGTVEAIGVKNGAGIGGGAEGSGGIITIQGGTVTATGGSYGAAGIGGGWQGDGGSVTIIGGIVTANGGEDGGAGIGGGVMGNGGDVTITGGTVTATGDDYGAGIGGGFKAGGGNVTITGGTVTATGGTMGAGIGGGSEGDGGSVTVTGGSVTAIGGSGCWNGIGGGCYSSGNGTLTVAEGYVVKGGVDADSLAVLEAPYETRLPYMTVKPVPKVSFVWSWDGSEPTAVLKCLWPDGSEEDILAEMSVSESEGVITYVSTAEVDGETYTASKSVNVEYTVEVINGTITSGAKDSYVYGDTIIVTAGAAPAGKSFAGWHNGAGELVSTSAVYGVAIDRDIVLEARYADVPVEIKPTLTASDTPREYDASADKYKTVLSASWSVPQGYKLVEAGLIRAYAKAQPSKDTLINGGTKKASTLKKANGTFNLNISIGASKKDYGLYYVGYLTYKAPDGKTNTVYTEIGCNAPVS